MNHETISRRAFLVSFLAFSLVLNGGCQGNDAEADEPSYQGQPASFWIKLLKEESDAGRSGIIPASASLWEQVGPEAVPVLLEALKDKDAGVRSYAVRYLSAVGPRHKGVVPAIAKVLTDKDAAVRFTAISSLMRLGAAAESAMPALIDTLKTDRRTDNRWHAAYALAAIGPAAKTGAPALLEALENDNDYVRGAIWSALTKIDPVITQGRELPPELKPAQAGKEAREPTRHPSWRSLSSATHTFKGHGAQVYGLAYSPDGKSLASVSGDHTVKVWEAASGRKTMTLKAHNAYSVAYSPDGRLLATGSLSNTVTIWDAATGKEVRSLTGHTMSVFTVAFSPDGRRLASASMGGALKVWEVATGKEVYSVGEEGQADRGNQPRITHATFSPDGKFLAGTAPGELVVLQASTGEEVRSFRKWRKVFSCVAFDPSSQRLAAGTGPGLPPDPDGEVIVWDIATGKETYSLRAHIGQVNSLAFSSDGRRLASGQDQTVKVWETATGKELLCLSGHTGPVTCVAFSPDGRHLASASTDRTVRIWAVMRPSEETEPQGGGEAAVEKKQAEAPQTPPANEQWGKTTQGLQMSLSVRGKDKDARPQLAVAIRNVGDQDVTLNLGMMLANGKPLNGGHALFPSNIRLKLTDAQGKTRDLDLSMPGIAGRVDDYLVMLRVGSVYSLPLPWRDFSSPNTKELAFQLKPGKQQISAEFVGCKAKHGSGQFIMNFWEGTLTSNMLELEPLNRAGAKDDLHQIPADARTSRLNRSSRWLAVAM